MPLKRTNQQTIGEVLQEWVNEHAWSVKATESRIRLAFNEMFGPAIVAHTQAVRFEMGGRVRIKTNSASLRNELSYSKELIKDRLNQALGKELVKEVVIV